MILKRFAPLIVLVLLFSSCAEKFDGYKIDGHIEGMTNENVYLEFLSPTAATVIDTASVDENGKFVMKGKVIEKGFHRIRNEQSDKFWILLVEDNGIGFDASKSHRHDSRGLQSIFARASMLGGTLEIDSRKGAGTSITLSAPCMLNVD